MTDKLNYGRVNGDSELIKFPLRTEEDVPLEPDQEVTE